MKTNARLFRPLKILLLAGALLPLAGCGKQAEEDAAKAAESAAAAEQAAKEAQESQKSLASELATVKRSAEETASKLEQDVEQKLQEQERKMAEQKEALEAEMNEKLEAQRQALVEEFQESNRGLEERFQSLKSQYEKAKPALPADTAGQLDQTLGNWNSSIQSLKSMVASFSPDSLEQLEAFKSEYGDELAAAKRYGEQAMELLKKSGIDLSKIDASSLGF